MATRREITKKYAADCAKSSKNAKGLILDEVVAVTGWSRANARRAQSTARKRKGPAKSVTRKPRGRTHGYDTLKVLIGVRRLAGIVTHADTHHVALITENGKHLADKKFLAVGSGYREIAEYITTHGPVTAVGVEGTGSYGAEPARMLAKEGFDIVEVNRPNRAHRRLHGKSDPLDAYQAAESVLAGRGTSTPKTRDGYVEALRVLRTARTSALKARTAVLTQISGVLTAAPETVRARYRGQSWISGPSATSDIELERVEGPRTLDVLIVWN